MMKRLFAVMLLLVLTACTDSAVISPPQTWKDMSFRVETRPPIIEPGMIEFLVVANRGERKRAHDLLVSLRMNGSGKWIQAIQDGHVGVYRRAVRVTDPKTDNLNVHVKYGDDEKILVFPLDFAIPKASGS